MSHGLRWPVATGAAFVGATDRGLLSVGGSVALLLASACAQPTAASRPPEEFMAAGERALRWTERFVEMGPRPSGSEALAAQAGLIVDHLGRLSCQVEEDPFVAQTPVGALPMRNVIARFGALSASPAVVVSGHYDTKRLPGFVGANDGGSSAGLLMALAERIDRTAVGPVWLVFFDGEESTVEWRDGDHTYGSRRLAQMWLADGTTRRVRALINVDMIGDADLQLVYEGNSEPALRDTVWQIGRELGYADTFSGMIGYIEDDHVPFLRAGIPSINLIDFTFGPRNSYWHTAEDTIDKLDASSFATVLHVLDVAIGRLLAD